MQITFWKSDAYSFIQHKFCWCIWQFHSKFAHHTGASYFLLEWFEHKKLTREELFIGVQKIELEKCSFSVITVQLTLWPIHCTILNLNFRLLIKISPCHFSLLNKNLRKIQYGVLYCLQCCWRPKWPIQVTKT